MKKDAKYNKKSLSSTKIKNISEMERVIDRILLEKKNKIILKDETDRFEKRHSNKKELESFDVKKISPVNRKKDSIYFVKDKKKPIRQQEKSTRSGKSKVGIEKLKKKFVLSGKKTRERPAISKLNKRFNLGKEKRGLKNLSKKNTKKPDSTNKDRPTSHLDKPFKKSSQEEVKGLHDITSVASTAPSDKEIPEKPKHFEKLFAKKKKETSETERKKFFSFKLGTKAPKRSLETDIEINKKTTKKVSHTDKEKPHLHLDEFVEKLTSDEAEWLDQQIKKADTFKVDEHKKTLDDITSVASTTPSDKEIPEKPKHFEKLLGIASRRKETGKTEPKKFFSIKRHPATSKIPGTKSVTEETKSVVLTKEHMDKKKHLPIHTTEETTPGGKFRHSFFGKIKRLKGYSQASNKLDIQYKQPSPQKIQFESINPDGKINLVEEVQQLKSKIIKNLGYSEGGWEELDFYPLHEPFAYADIIREKETLDKQYILVEAELSKEEAQLLDFMKETLAGFSLDTKELEQKGEKKYLIEKIDQVLDDYMIRVDDPSKKKIIYFLEKQFLGLHKLEVLMRDPNIEDISCDGYGVPLFLYHRRYGSLKGSIQFDEEEELSAFVVKLAQKCGKHISISEPMLDATMPDGSRIQMTLSTEVTTKGSTFTIRKFKEDPFSPPDLVEFNTMSSEMIAYMWMAVENGINALIAGGTAAGKTSTLNALSLFIPRESKIVSIEETREINLPHPNWIPGVSRSGFGEVVGNKVVGEIDLYDLMKAALRQRPEYILVGEIRGREAYVLFQAMSTGHTTYSTVHADSAQSLIHRLEGKPINIPRIMLQALDIVCIQIISRIKNKRARRCKQVIEIIDIDPATKEILTNEVFRWDPVEDKFIYSGKSYILERIRADKDLSREEMTNEIKNRAKLLEWMNRNNIREFKKVSILISQYFENPAKIMEKITDEL